MCVCITYTYRSVCEILKSLINRDKVWLDRIITYDKDQYINKFYLSSKKPVLKNQVPIFRLWSNRLVNEESLILTYSLRLELDGRKTLFSLYLNFDNRHQ